MSGPDVRTFDATGTRPTMSCVVIAFNEEENIEACLDSVLGQTGPEFDEVVVVDDCSADATPDIVRRVSARDGRVRLERLAVNQGRGGARAAGCRAVSGDLVAMVDGDIILPAGWLGTCRDAVEKHDAVGGIAVPDGDAAYVGRRFGLIPRPTRQTTTITGNNGLYRSDALRETGFDPALRNGEDIAINHALRERGYSLYTIPGLHVAHSENKTFGQAVRWLYESGVGASRQFREFGELRVPDLATGVFVALLAVDSAMLMRRRHPGVPLTALYVFGVAATHTASRFRLSASGVGAGTAAIGVNSVLIGAYFLGRVRGVVAR